MRKIMAMLLCVVMLLSAGACAADGRVTLTDEAQTYNALLAAEKINQTVLQQGESFSFNKTVGRRTEENGFIPALNGRGIEVVGGGVAQAASALYLALLELAPGMISFDELSFYGDRYTGSYVADGGQAVLVDHKNGRDFRFTNLMDGELTISMQQEDGMLVCRVSEAAEPVVFEEAQISRPAMGGPTVSVRLECGNDPDVLANIALAAGSIYDLTLTKGDEFSFNALVGPLEAEYGYVEATDGYGEKSMGGGAAQVASALWLLMQNCGDIEIIEMTTYGEGYNQSYVSSSADAIYVDYAAGTDFAFRYVGETSLTLYPMLLDTTLTLIAA